MTEDPKLEQLKRDEEKAQRSYEQAGRDILSAQRRQRIAREKWNEAMTARTRYEVERDLKGE